MREPSTKLKIDEIEEIALNAGAGYWAVKKWRARRSVPMKWRVRLVEANPEKIRLRDFEVYNLQPEAAE